MDSLTIELPWPSADLSPNARGKWNGIKARKKAKNDAWAMTNSLMGPLRIRPGSWGGPIDVQITFYPSMDRARDLDNFQASMKAALDGIALALGVNDTHFRPVSAWGEKRKPACVVVTLTPATVSLPVKGRTG